MKSVDGRKRCWKCKVWFDEPEKHFNKALGKPEGLDDQCRECANAYHRDWSKNKDGLAKMRASQKKRWASGKGRDYHYRTLYGITLADYEKMEREQQGCCAICGLKRRRLAVDHDHKTGRVRGLLCGGCNATLARLGDDESVIQKFIDYFKE